MCKVPFHMTRTTCGKRILPPLVQPLDYTWQEKGGVTDKTSILTFFVNPTVTLPTYEPSITS